MQFVAARRVMKKILIANRSEIALRIQYTAQARGIKTVVVYAPEDAAAAFVSNADEAYQLVGHGFSAYLAQDEIIEIAQKAGADALHPGYGFLSENADFARKVLAAGITWIGPEPESIALMGCKAQARALMQQEGIPIVPGQVHDFEHEDFNPIELMRQAEEIGYPLILKDPRGGGGKAIRRVQSAIDFIPALTAVISEAKRLTGSSEVLIEKYIEKGRHIEVQIAGDGVRVIHLFERECSIQRRHQKIIEESPGIFVRPETLERMYDFAVHVGKAVRYKNIGTVEFIVTPEEHVYFLEMNTRLQVEHAVTEFITGIDLVGLQIDIAQTDQLLLTQEGVTRRGHAIECRIYSEDPAQKFFPSTGVIEVLSVPAGPFIRCDFDLHEGKEITPLFDPMLAKVITHGSSRLEALQRMMHALEHFVIEGVTTNILFLKKVLAAAFFCEGTFHTQLLNDPTFVREIFASEAVALGVTHFLSDDDIAALATALEGIFEEDEKKSCASHKLFGMADYWRAQQQWRRQQW